MNFYRILFAACAATSGLASDVAKRNETNTDMPLRSKMINVPFRFEDKTFVYKVNVSETKAQYNSGLPDPRQSITKYEVEWPGNQTLRHVLQSTEGLGSDALPRFQFTTKAVPLSDEATNAYDFNNPGSCVGPLGQKCLDAISKQKFDNTANKTDWRAPAECTELQGQNTYDGITRVHLGPESVTSGPHSQDASLLTSNSYPAKYDGQTPFDVEVQRVHVTIFSGTRVWPVCLRISDQKVETNNHTGGSSDTNNSSDSDNQDKPDHGAAALSTASLSSLAAALVFAVGFTLL